MPAPKKDPAKLSQSPAAVRARNRRAGSTKPQEAASPLYNPDPEADAAPPERRGPGRPPGTTRQMPLKQSIAKLIAFANLPLSILVPTDAFTKEEIVTLADGLVDDPWTGPYCAKLRETGAHSGLIWAVSLIVLERLDRHGVFRFAPGGGLGGLIAEMMGAEAQSRDANVPAEPAEPTPIIRNVPAVPINDGVPPWLKPPDVGASIPLAAG